MPAERWLDQEYKKRRFCGEGITRARPCSSNAMLRTRTGAQGNPAPRTTEHRRSNIHGTSRGGFTIAKDCQSSLFEPRWSSSARRMPEIRALLASVSLELRVRGFRASRDLPALAPHRVRQLTSPEIGALLERGYANRTSGALVARVVFASTFNRATHLSGLTVQSSSIEHPGISDFRHQVFRAATSERMIEDG